MNYLYKITIFTPTYNRENMLPKLYESLVKQAVKKFEWLIVDDGSTDHTENLVASWISEKKIDIKYVKQENGGKHRAINRGLDFAKGELFFIVDSDDFLPSNSISIIEEHSKRIEGDIVGIVGRKQYTNEVKIGDVFPVNEFVSDHIEKTYIKGIKGDLAEVVKTDVLRQCKFPDFKGENFCAESLMWNKTINIGKLLFFDIPIYTAEYLENGLSANSIRNRRKSPTYAMQLYSELVKDKRLPVFMKIRTYINFWRFSFFSPLSFFEKWRKLDSSTLGLFIIPIAYLIKIRDTMTNK